MVTQIFSIKHLKQAWQEVVMLYCGLLCGLRSPLGWVGVHLAPEFADTEKDPIVQSSIWYKNF